MQEIRTSVEKLCTSYRAEQKRRESTSCDAPKSDRRGGQSLFNVCRLGERGRQQENRASFEKFATYCKPQQNVPFERYRFNRRVQEPGESYDQYRTALRKLAEGCSFDTITPEEILRDHLVFGIRDAKVRRQLLCETNLSLKKTDEICRTSESTAEQMKVVEENPETKQVNAVNQPSKREPRAGNERNGSRLQSPQESNNMATKECGNCGKAHDLKRRESCPAFRRTCSKCGK